MQDCPCHKSTQGRTRRRFSTPPGNGGDITVATISEPLTFNLAIATDASSSGVLSYLFEGLTETFMAERPCRTLFGQVMGGGRGTE